MIEHYIECNVNGLGPRRIKSVDGLDQAIKTVRLIQSNENKPLYQYPDIWLTDALVDQVGKWVTLSGPCQIIEVETRVIAVP